MDCVSIMFCVHSHSYTDVTIRMQLLEVYCVWVSGTKTHEQAKGLNQRPSQYCSNHSATAAFNKRVNFLTLIFLRYFKKIDLLKMAAFL